MKFVLPARAFALLLLVAATVLHAQVPQFINYQGRVAVGTVNFDGPGAFKFALVNGNGSVTYWSNDGTGAAGSEPTAAVSLAVTKGLYSVLLGDATLPYMTIVPAMVFANPDVRLRVWFDDGTHGSQLLTPDQRIAAVGYAMMAGNAALAQSVPDGAITSAKIAPGAVQSSNLAPGTVFSWQSVSGTSQLAQANTGYTANDPARVTVTLPAAPNIGDTVRVLGAGAGGWSIAPNAGQSVLGGSAAGSSWTGHDPVKNWYFVASSADGSKLVAQVFNEHVYTSTNSGATWTEHLTDANRIWNGVASDSNGVNLISVGQSNTIYVSGDSGTTWNARPVPAQPSSGWIGAASSGTGGKLFIVAPGWAVRTSIDSGLNWTALPSGAPSWTAVACSSDGSRVVATTNGGGIYTATNAGANAVDWTQHNGGGVGLADTAAAWNSVASSFSGQYLVATTNGGKIYTSTDYGASWTAQDQNRAWTQVASSVDGKNLAATVYGDKVYTSSDYGAHWLPRDSNRNWQCLASSADGNNLVAGVFAGQIYTSQQYLTGAQGSTAELQYIGNGQWQAANQSLIASGAVGTSQLAAGAVTANAIASGAVNSTAIANGAVGSTQIANGAVSSAQLSDSGIGTNKLADNAVTAPKIGTGQVVKSLTKGGVTLTDAITLVEGPNVTIAPSGNSLMISAAAAGNANAVNTIDDLRNYSLQGVAPNDTVLVKGYWAAGDGGGGVFIWNAADTRQNNGGTIIASQGSAGAGRWNRIIEGPWSVRWFGAKGNGTTFDGGAFANAIAAMEGGFFVSDAPANNSAGIVLRVPAGEYPIGDLIIQRQIWLQGEASSTAHPSTVLTIQPGSHGLIIQTRITSRAASGDGTIISNLAIRGTAGSRDGIQIWSPQVTVRDVEISNMGGNGIMVDSRDPLVGAKPNAERWRIQSCFIHGCGSGATGVANDPAAADNLARNGCGMYLIGGDAHGGICTGTLFQTNAWWGLWDNSDLGNVYVGCVFENNGLTKGTSGSIPLGGQARVGEPLAGLGYVNAATFMNCHTEQGERCYLPVGNVTVVGGLMPGAPGVKDKDGQAVQRVGASASRLYFTDENDRGLFRLQIPDAGQGASTSSAFSFDYQQFVDVATTSPQKVTWALKRFKPTTGSDPTGKLSEIDGPSTWDSGDTQFDRCWAFASISLPAPSVPFGWTDGTHPRGAGHPFFRVPTINQRAHFSIRSNEISMAAGETAVVIFKDDSFNWLNADPNDPDAVLVPQFSVQLSTPLPAYQTTLPLLLAGNGNVHVGAYSIERNPTQGQTGWVCRVAVKNDNSATVNVFVNASFERYKKWNTEGDGAKAPAP